MVNAIAKLHARRKEIVQALLAIRSLERGALSEQYFTRPGLPGQPSVKRGPYYVISRWEEGRNRSRRIKREAVSQVRKDLENHERFMALCKELEELTRQLGVLEREGAASQEAVKKGRKSRSSRTRK